MDRKNMAGKNSRTCTFGKNFKNIVISSNLSSEIALNGYLDKFPT